MTKDDALRMAIEVMEDYHQAMIAQGFQGGKMLLDTIHNCKAALEKPLTRDWKETIDKRIARDSEFKAALQEDALDRMAENARELGLEWEGEQEPVAWHSPVAYVSKSDLLKIQHRHPPISREKILDDDIPLYTRPTKRLSDDEVFALCPYKSGRQEDNSFCGEEEFYRGFRAAEQAHGIGESDG